MALALYIAGTVVLLAADLLVTRLLVPEQIALWAEVRALIGVLGVLAAGGLDLVFVRAPASSARLLRLAAVQVPLASLPLGLGAHALGFLSGWGAAAALAAGSAFGLVLAQYFRAHRRFLASQLVQQGWKAGALAAVALAAVMPGLPPLDAVLAALLLATAGAGAAAALGRLRPASLLPQAPDPTGALYAIGLRFMVTSLILALAVYGEQLLVSGLGGTQAAAVFFTHATYFLFPISVLNGYVGFRIGPWLRDNHDRFAATLARRWPMILAATTLYAALMHGLGWLGWLALAPAAGDPDPLLQAAFLASAVARTLYTLPSGYNGVFARPRQHDLLIAAQIVLLAAVALGVYLALDAMVLVHLVALAGAANWTLRTAIGFWITARIIASRKGQDAAS